MMARSWRFPGLTRRWLWPLLVGLSGGGLLVMLLLGWTLLRIPVGPAGPPETAPASLALEGQDGTAFAVRGQARGEPVRAESLPQPLADAVLAIEDRRFRHHPGLDAWGLLRATARNLTTDRRAEGASTITQQLARMTWLSQERSLTRKLQEAMLALWLETQLPKDEILARYLNTAYFGAGAVGADAAARRYFGKPAGDLSLAEAALLAGLLRAPSALAPTRNLEGAQARARLVLGAMEEEGLATPEALAGARATPPVLQAPPEPLPGRGYVADWAEGEARRLIGPVPMDLSVRTTLDPRLQDLAEAVVATHLQKEGARLKVGQAALLALGPDGAVLAAVGGRDYAESQFSRVTQAKRQPGSLFKLFVYAAALEAGWSPEQVVQDQPIRIGDWAPGNADGRFRGPVTLRQAFASSINSVAVQLQEQVGRPQVAAMAQRLGLKEAPAPNPSMALGTGSATLAEMVAAYGSIGYGRRLEPWLVREVHARDRVLYRRPEDRPGPPPVEPAVQQGLLSLMLAAVQEGTGRAARLERPVAGKTGTTQDNRDAWFIGITADAVVGVWVGNDDNTPMGEVSGGGLPARIWQDFMRQADRVLGTTAPDTSPATTAPEATARPQERLRGVPEVLDTGTLAMGGRVLRLAGVAGLPGEPGAMMAQWIGGRAADCIAGEGNAWRCRVEGRDLSELVLSNGGGRATADAPPELRRAEAAARAARLGLWQN